MAQDTILPTEVTQGMVAYTDGGARPTNPGYAGSGIHGYLYLAEPPKKPAGVPDHIVTMRGYVAKTDAQTQPKAVKEELGITGEMAPAPGGKERRSYDRIIEVTPVHYFDIYAAYDDPKTSNNAAEMSAAKFAMLHALDYDVKELQILSDSEYTCKGMNEWVKDWKGNNWQKASGEIPKNVELWKELEEVRERLVQRGIRVRFNWVKAHTKISDELFHLGNNMADCLATIGCIASMRLQESRVVKSVRVAEGYWKYSVDKHPFISHRRMYFNTMREHLIPGEYYLGDHGKDDDLLGKRTSDGSFAVVMLEQPDPVLEGLRMFQSDLAEGTDQIIFARLDSLYRAETHRQLAEYGMLATEQANKYRLDLRCIDKEPLTRQCQPAKLAMRAVDSVSLLAAKLHQYLRGDANVIVTNLTPILYETTGKVNKKGETLTEMKLKAEYNVGYAALNVDAYYACGDVKDELKAAPITLTLGIDMLDRNSLKRLEDRNPKVSLITWRESPTVFRYATVVECGNDKGIWAGVYSNMRVVSEKVAK